MSIPETKPSTSHMHCNSGLCWLEAGMQRTDEGLRAIMWVCVLESMYIEKGSINFDSGSIEIRETGKLVILSLGTLGAVQWGGHLSCL